MSEADGVLDKAGGASSEAKTKALVLLLGLGWAMNWVTTKIALSALPPWTLRVFGVGGGALTLFIIARLFHRRVAVPAGQRLHIVVASLLNVGIFNFCSASAQTASATSRVVIVAYTMPIWAALIAWLTLGERFSAMRILALTLCVVGLGILVFPLLAGGVPIGIYYALGCAVSWAAGTIYLKWARVEAEPLAVAAWQLVGGALFLIAGMLAVEGVPHVWPLPPSVVLAVVYNAVIGLGICYFLWFDSIVRLPAMTASLGVLIVPVFGIALSALMLGDRPPLTDLVGFALVFAAAACVLLRRDEPATKPEFPE